MSKKLNRLKYALNNTKILLKNVVIKRDNRIVLIGAWMGTKFADNSRYLYQFLFENKHSMGIDRVIWVTRSIEVKSTLESMGYEVYLIGSKESDYWHLKAGIHMICNAAYDLTMFKSDIDTKLSFGAKKIQLWHGVGGIKAVGAASNKAQSSLSKNSMIKKIMRSHIINSFLSPGGWGEAYILATGKNCAFCNVLYTNCREDRIFISDYPRNCQCIKYLPKEEEFIEHIKRYNGCFLYLPTFRSDSTNFIHPLTNSKIVDLLKEKNLLWIEKPHTADLNSDAVINNIDNVYNLEPDFDVNTIYKYMTCIITDYSSVSFDSVHHNIPLAIYAPDIEEFKNGDVGFIIDFETLFSKMLSTNCDCLFSLLLEAVNNRSAYIDNRNLVLQEIDSFAFDNRKLTYEEIWKDICNLK